MVLAFDRDQHQPLKHDCLGGHSSKPSCLSVLEVSLALDITDSLVHARAKNCDTNLSARCLRQGCHAFIACTDYRRPY